MEFLKKEKMRIYTPEEQIDTFLAYIEPEKTDYKSFVDTLLDFFSLPELELFIKHIKSDYKEHFLLIDREFERRLLEYQCQNEVVAMEPKEFASIRTMFYEKVNWISGSLNEGFIIAFWIGEINKLRQIRNPYLEILAKRLIKYMFTEISKALFVLERKMNSHNYIPAEMAVFTFFIYDREQAVNKFSHVFEKDIKNRRNNAFIEEYWPTLDSFFSKLRIDYVPKIEFDEFGKIKSFSNQAESISKRDILRIIDNEDYFSSRSPLFDCDTYLNLLNDFGDNPKEYAPQVEKVFSAFFKTITKDREYHIDIGKVLFTALTDPYPIYSKNDLHFVRLEILELFKNKEIKKDFFGIIYELHTSIDKYITNWTNKFPKVFNAFMRDAQGYSIDGLKNYFKNDKKRNPAMDRIEIQDIIFQNSTLRP